MEPFLLDLTAKLDVILFVNTLYEIAVVSLPYHDN